MGGMLWSDAQKKALVETAVNWQLLQGMIGIEQASLYEAYCNQLRRVNHNLQRVEYLSKKKTDLQPLLTTNLPCTDVTLSRLTGNQPLPS